MQQKEILYPTDFSDVSKRALDYIRQLKADLDHQALNLGFLPMERANPAWTGSSGTIFKKLN